MTHVTSLQALQKVEKVTAEKNESSDECRKLGGFGADVTWRGSSFRTRAAATGKAR